MPYLKGMFLKLFKTLSALCLLFTLFVGSISPSYAQRQEVIREIRVNGAERIEPTTVLSYLGVEVGEAASSETLNQALKNLYGTSLFADVSMRLDRNILFVDVVENPVINEIAFEGNDQVEDNQLLAEISARPRQVFTRTQVQNDVSRINQIYRRSGYFAASVDPKIIKLDQNRVNLVFEVVEGAETKIKGIRFVGNEVFDDDTLRSELATKEECGACQG